ncbi:hypothetical protein XFF6166_110022 [Xanthomonas citri pv. fuscans]|nr:hypothetical protein XFF6166_110022 [Xanthomonas citri pv. fuscans]SOO04688.1 hypothetical protein XFF7767_280036 [Xanthomonas citri pv. fuscans]SOO08173.1 hypothetical protein XFF6970_160019 [Xanthomonas citri pv. fuscans]SOO16820.1 hypothetical protein XFF7766_890014 [Xanthomonas citri pv. fuscans]SOO17131.1 hypothetical protein XFF6992_140091 [Xanthomonas citri pv. fuscans]
MWGIWKLGARTGVARHHRAHGGNRGRQFDACYGNALSNPESRSLRPSICRLAGIAMRGQSP